MDLPIALYLLSSVIVPASPFVLVGVYLRWRRRRRNPCRRHERLTIPAAAGPVTLCRECDAGDVVDGQWEFAPPVEADHTL